MKIGIIGAAEMGSCLASAFVNSGHQVAIANSRGPASLQQLAEKIGAEPATVEQVTKDRDVIVISIPTRNVPSLPKSLFQQLPEGVVVIDTMNYYPSLRDGVIADLEDTGIDSLWVQQQLGISVVKVFNSILATSIKDKPKAKGEKGRIAMAVSGDDTKAKEIVFQLVEQLGFDYFDVGPIDQSWKQQPGSSIYCRDIGLEELQRRVRRMRNEWSIMRETVLAKRKADESLMAKDYSAYLESLQN